MNIEEYKNEIYKLLKPMPGHDPGDLIILSDQDYFIYEKEPKYKIDPEQIQKNPTWFEKIILGWDRGQLIYFLDVLGNVIEDNFNPERHASIIYKKRAFKTKKDALNFSNKIKSLLYNESILINKDIINDILSKEKISEIKSILNKYI